MPPKAELKMDTFLEPTPEAQAEAEATLAETMKDLDFQRSEEQTVSDAATFEDMLGEAWEIQSKGMTFFAVPPPLGQLKGIIDLMRKQSTARAASLFDQELEINKELGRRLFWIKEGDTLRSARADEIAEKLNAHRLVHEIETTLVRNGLELDPKKKSSSPTGAISISESLNDLEVIPSPG